jgi:hypothetical protein
MENIVRIRRKLSVVMLMHMPFAMLAFAAYVNPTTDLWMYTLFAYLGYVLGLVVMDSAWDAEKRAGKYL